MKFLDTFANEGVLLFNNNSFLFKSSIGAFFTVLQILISIVVIIFLGSRKFDIKTNLYSSLKGENEKESKISMLLKYSRELDYLNWSISDSSSRGEMYENFHQCTDSEYESFYNTTIKELNMSYKCITTYLEKEYYGSKTFLIECPDEDYNCIMKYEFEEFEKKVQIRNRIFY